MGGGTFSGRHQESCKSFLDVSVDCDVGAASCSRGLFSVLYAMQLHARKHTDAKSSFDPIVYHPPKGKICLDEIKSTIRMPEYNASVANYKSNHNAIAINKVVMNQLREFVTAIASMYRDNPFHKYVFSLLVCM